MNAPLIRSVQPGDGEALFSLFVRSAHQLGGAHYTREQLDAWTSGLNGARLEARLLKMTSVVATHESTTQKSNAQKSVIVGFGSIDLQSDELDFLYVDPNHARQGVATLLFAYLEKQALAHQRHEINLTASLNAVPAYERLGFTVVRSMVKTIHRIPIPCTRMQKPIP